MNEMLVFTITTWIVLALVWIAAWFGSYSTGFIGCLWWLGLVLAITFTIVGCLQ